MMFEVGDKVHCVIYGDGVVSSVDPMDGVGVKFIINDLTFVREYNENGHLYLDTDSTLLSNKRALYFGDPEISGKTLKAPKPFCKVGDTIIKTDKQTAMVLTVKEIIAFDNGKEAYNKYRYDNQMGFDLYFVDKRDTSNNFYLLGEDGLLTKVL